MKSLYIVVVFSFFLCYSFSCAAADNVMYKSIYKALTLVTLARSAQYKNNRVYKI